MNSPVIMKMLSLQTNFTPTENEISQFIVKNQDFVITNTIISLAEAVKTSEASINRFVRKIGYRGFNNFKIALAQNKFQEEVLDDLLDSGNVIESVSADYRQMILNTSALMNSTDIERIITLIKKSVFIRVVSPSHNGFVANDFASKLESVGFNTKVYKDNIEISLSLQNLNNESLVFVIAPSIQTKDLYSFVTNAKERGAKVVVITSHDFNDLDDLTDVKIIVSDKNISRNPMSMSNSLVNLYAVDTIFEALLRSDKNLRQKKLNSDAVINNQQVMSHYYFDM